MSNPEDQAIAAMFGITTEPPEPDVRSAVETQASTDHEPTTETNNASTSEQGAAFLAELFGDR